MSNWTKAYQLNRAGIKTGRWMWVDETGEQDMFYPRKGWLKKGSKVKPPKKATK